MSKHDRNVREIPDTTPVKLDEELFHEDLRAKNPDLPPWSDMDGAARDIVRSQTRKIYFASRVAERVIVQRLIAA